jgi:hypothetical protein
VTFELGCRNNWHSHPAGQILVVTAGQGYYQEKGQPAQLLRPGDAATTVATDTAPKMVDRALGTSLAGTKRMATAADMAQKPPMATPSSTRPMVRTRKVGAKATNALDKTCSTENESRTQRRSKRLVTTAMSRLANMATTAVIEMACPARPSVIAKSRAIGVSRLTGRNSEVIKPDTPRARANTAFQAGFVVRTSGR